ncbi:MAG: cobalamin biosynthesis protein P47K, partial [Planctomycetales bacterium]|nr:cobalamin biosynthesis protein P47K [Planctomycetales bacterium]
ELVATLDRQGEFGQKRVELDYDVYAEGEAELGWLNSSLTVVSNQKFSLDALLLELVERLRNSLATIEAEAAHLKAIGLWEGFYGVANLISSDSPAQLSLPADCQTDAAELVINARVAVAPETLQEHVERAVAETCKALGATANFRQTRSFRPGRPVPTHRLN